jgi:hypothetical protein
MHPSSSRAFKRHQEHDLKHPSTVDLITTKQNKLPSFIDRLLAFIINLHTLDMHCSRVYSWGNNLGGGWLKERSVNWGSPPRVQFATIGDFSWRSLERTRIHPSLVGTQPFISMQWLHLRPCSLPSAAPLSAHYALNLVLHPLFSGYQVLSVSALRGGH